MAGDSVSSPARAARRYPGILLRAFLRAFLCAFPPVRPGTLRTLFSLLLGLLFTAATLLASAQLPGGKQPEFTPVIPEFTESSADWWTGWTDASHEEREQWLRDLSEQWGKWRDNLPDNKALQARAQAIGAALEGIENTWKERDEYRKIEVLPEVEFPPSPDVLAWAEVDAAVYRGRQRLLGLQLEASELGETLEQSLTRMHREVVALRDVDEGGKKEAAALDLLLTQINHLNVVEQHTALTRQLEIWQAQVDLAEEQLQRMLKELHYSKDARASLQKTLEEQSAKIDALAKKRAELQRPRDSAAPQDRMRRDVARMQLQIDLLQARLEQRKAQLLQSMNRVLGEGDSGGKQKLVASRNLLERARAVIDDITRQSSLRQRQVAAWGDEEGEDLSRWWREFERVDSGVVRARDLIEDVVRYQSAQLQVYRAHRGWWATVRERTGYFVRRMSLGWRQLADYQLFTIAQNPITLRIIARIIFVLVCAWLISSLIRRFLKRLVRRKRASKSSMYNLGRVLHYCIIAIALVVALSMLGLDTSKLALVAGALSVGIGFGLQAIFSNFISGLMLLFEQPLRVGDLVELESGVFGRIRDINVRSTRITTRDNIDILVPNSEFVTGRVINHTLYDPVRRIHVPFRVAFDCDPELVQEAAMAAAEQVNITHTDWKRKTEVWLMEFGDSSLTFKLVVWINSNMVSPLDDPYALYNMELLKELRERNIKVPYPQRELHLRNWGKLGSE